MMRRGSAGARDAGSTTACDDAGTRQPTTRTRHTDASVARRSESAKPKKRSIRQKHVRLIRLIRLIRSPLVIDVGPGAYTLAASYARFTGRGGLGSFIAAF